MSRRLRMTAELGDWLTELSDSAPATAAEVAASLVAALIAADTAHLPTLGEPAASLLPAPGGSADHTYQRLLEELQHIRRSVSDMAASRRRGELRIEAERDAGADAARLADLERDLANIRLIEAEMTEQSQRIQQRVDAFRTAKETAKAIYTAAEAQLRIAEVMEAAGEDPGTDLGQLREELRVAEEKLRATRPGVTVIRPVSAAADAGHPAGAEHREPPRPPQPTVEPPAGLLQLRADPLGPDIRILLAIEPADTVTLLAVLEGPEAVSEHWAEAIKLASDLLTEIRADGWPADIDEVTFANAGAFLARFFPDNDGTSSADEEA